MQKVDPFSKPNLEDFYALGAEIGSGAFSVVKKATRKEDGKEVAVKIINKFKHRHDLDLIRDEVAVMRAVRGHYHVVNMIDTFETDVFLYIVMELIVGGELFEKIVTKGYYSEADSAKIIRQIVKGVAFCHSKGVVHRDLKPENLLCANDEIESLSITDFGIAKLLLPGQKIRGSCGSPSYVSPEILLKQEYSFEVDMWAVGVISYILIAGYKPFDEEASSLPVHMQIINAEYEFPKAEWDEISDTAKDFIRRLLCKDVKSRMTAEQALQHPFIFEDAPLSNRSLNRTMEKLKEFNSTRKFKQAAFAIISGNRMKLTSLQQNTKELRLRPSKRNLLDGAVSPKDTKTESIAQPEQGSNDTVTERKSSARIITNLVSPKSPSNPSIVLEPPVERVELVVVEKEDERDEVMSDDQYYFGSTISLTLAQDTEPSVALSINCAPDHMQGTAMIKEIRTIDVPANGQVMLDSVPTHMIPSSVHFHSFTDPTAVITKQRFSSEDNKSRLMWSLDTTKTGKHTVQIFYETKHMGWHASYTALLNDNETSIVLNGYYNIANYSGRSFTRPTVALVQDPEQFELDTPIDLTDHQEVKVPFARKLTFSVKTINMFKGSPFQDYEESLVFKQYAHNKAVTEPPRVNSVIMFLDDETKAIDFEILKSLPKGAMQVYQQISETHRHVTNTYVASLHITDGHQQYAHFEASTPVSQSAQSTQSGVSVKSTGPRLAALVEQLQGTNRKKDIVPSLPKLDKAPRGELTLGPVPFLQAKRVQKKFEVIHGDMVNESIQIRVKNTDAHATHTLMIEETMYRWREWKILFSNTAYSTPLVKENNKVHFTVEVKPGEERCVEYLVSYKNCLAM